MDQDLDPNLARIKKQLTCKNLIQRELKSPIEKALHSNVKKFLLQDDKLFYKKSYF